MATLLGFSGAIRTGTGTTGRCGPGVQIVPDPDPPGLCDRLDFPIELLAKLRVAGTPDGNPTNINFVFTESESLFADEVNGRLGLESTQPGSTPINERMFMTGLGTHGGTDFPGQNGNTINNVFGLWMWVRLQLEASTGANGKFWLDGSSEPGSWTTAAGVYSPPYGLIAALSVNATLGTTYWEVAQLTVTGYDGMTLLETFNRTVGGPGWGTSEFTLPVGFGVWDYGSGTASVTPGIAQLGPGTSDMAIQFPTCADS